MAEKPRFLGKGVQKVTECYTSVSEYCVAIRRVLPCLYIINADVGQGWLLLLSALICSIITSYRLTIAFEKYLRVHLSLATVLASQVVVLLAVLLVLVQFADFSRWV